MSNLRQLATDWIGAGRGTGATGDPKPRPVRAHTLDELWRNAERLGHVEVDHDFSNRDKYRVNIRFERASGTLVYARGTDPNIIFAMSKAIEEALDMGAGRRG